MRSLWFVRQGHVEWRDVPAPRLNGALEALVAPIAASSCDIDRYIVSHPSRFKEPFAIGHNGVAQVVEIGDEVKSVRPGDIVAVAWHISCGRCDRCKRGLLAHCRQSAPGTSYGLPTGERWGGLFDDLVRVPYADAMLHPLPKALDPVEFVATSDNLTQGYAAVAPHVKAGRNRILVFGWGINGLYAVAFARALGAREITYIDDNPTNRVTAIGLGAAALPGPPEPGIGPFDLVVDASLDPAWLRGAGTGRCHRMHRSCERRRPAGLAMVRQGRHAPLRHLQHGSPCRGRLQGDREQSGGPVQPMVRARGLGRRSAGRICGASPAARRRAPAGSPW
jgi:threonine dehydrogenase-like Zn-dependent dehydrogenase